MVFHRARYSFSQPKMASRVGISPHSKFRNVTSEPTCLTLTEQIRSGVTGMRPSLFFSRRLCNCDSGWFQRRCDNASARQTVLALYTNTTKIVSRTELGSNQQAVTKSAGPQCESVLIHRLRLPVPSSTREKCVSVERVVYFHSGEGRFQRLSTERFFFAVVG